MPGLTASRAALLVLGALLVVTGLLVSARAVEAQTTGGFASAPTFSNGGQAAVVFRGGSVASLETAARTSGATGVWAQDALGGFQLLVVDGPPFLRETFTSRFPAGFGSATAVTLTRPAGATSVPPPTVTQPPTGTPAGIPPTRGGVLGPSAND